LDERVLPLLGFTLVEKFSCNLRATFSNIIKLFLIIPHRLKAANPPERRKVDEVIVINSKELSYQVIVTISSCPINGRGKPPLVSCTLPSKRKICRRHIDN
jgi:hypothetical protein